MQADNIANETDPLIDRVNYLYDRQNVILETDASNKVKTRYVKGINYVASMSTGNKTSYFLFNGHGDVVQTVNKTGEVQNNYEYDIWGNPTLTVETVECAIRYAGEFYDSETGLYYLRARYYDPYIGRFISEDSYWGEDNNPLSLNRYTYTHNDPIQYLDPTGYAVLKNGSKGESVEKVQEMLKTLEYNVGKKDGEYGSKTEAAIVKFQKDHGIQADGIVGKQTLAMLNKMVANKDEPDNVKKRAMDSAAKVAPGQIEDNRMPQTNKVTNKPSTSASTGTGSKSTNVNSKGPEKQRRRTG